MQFLNAIPPFSLFLATSNQRLTSEIQKIKNNMKNPLSLYEPFTLYT